MTDEFSALLRSVGALEASVNHLHEDITEIHRKVDKLEEQAHQWKGGIAVVLALGAILGSVVVWVGERVWSATPPSP